MTTVPINKTTKSVPLVGNVPLVTGTSFFFARLPAMAKAGIIKRNLAISMSRPRVRLYQGVLALIPAKALPLFPAPLEYVYRISDRPCAALLFVFAVAGPGEFQYPPFANGATELMAVNAKTHREVARIAMIAILTSFCSIFLPTYSGVRPTINPPMKTARTAYINML